jgi:hypothetical protein
LAREEAEAQAARELDVPAFLDRRRFPHERDAEPYVYAIGYLFTPTLKESRSQFLLKIQVRNRAHSFNQERAVTQPVGPKAPAIS